MSRAPALLLALAAAAAAGAGDTRRSGFDDMSPATQALQRDDTLNPAALALADGEERYAAACARCHAAAAMRGVAPRYPAWDDEAGRPISLSERIERCRVRQAKAPPLAHESPERLALEAYVARQSRGLPIAPPADPRLTPWRERGRALYAQRFGQLDLSCSHCHDERAGRRLGGTVIPQGHPTGYPIYRLEWQGVGSLARRLRNCVAGVRAQPFEPGTPEFAALEAWLMQRAAGMALETPAVRP